MGDENPYQEAAKLLGASGSTILPRIIERIAGEKEVKIILAAFPPATIQELSEKSGIHAEEVSILLSDMFQKGLIFLSKKAGEQRYYRVKTVAQFHDSSVVWKGADRDFLNLWKEYMEKEWPRFGEVVESLLPKPVVRVIPVGANIESKARILPLEDVREIVFRAEKLAVTPCTCRLIDGKCGKPLEACIQVNRAAEYAITRGTGRPINTEEAIRILDLAEREGLVHIVDNRQTVDHIICNCCRDCCMNWRLPNPQKFVAPSRFLAQVNSDECFGCQACLDRCMFGALEMQGDEPKARVVAERCVGCGVCTITCPGEAISLKEIRPKESVPV
ncbi:MAG TPA: 4Fe-4S dicluster domain-containing protein [Thermodesulfobacteriota bacterium]|nr:4Fe-4S dicluster domain-containing protein [Thermodesulfobacteriota bacterium]